VQTPNNPNVYKCYSSGASPDLPYLNGNANKLSKMVNCFNYDDFALLAWQVNNFIKPANRYGYYYTPKYDFCTGYEDPGDGSTDTMFFLERNLHFPGDRYEIFAHAAQSWGNALGTGVVKGFSRSVNLKNAYNFDPADSHLYHSWQFRQTNHETRIFWNMVRKQCLN
jgi:hypothetical protein